MGRITIAVNEDTKKRLMRRMKYGDSFDSAINEILDKLDQEEEVKKECLTNTESHTTTE